MQARLEYTKAGLLESSRFTGPREGDQGSHPREEDREKECAHTGREKGEGGQNVWIL